MGEWKYVDLSELQAMMDPQSIQGKGLLWSPWFRHVVDRLLIRWWKDLDSTVNSDVCVDLDNIYRFSS